MTITGARPARPTFATVATPLAIITAIFLAFTLPLYVGLDPSRSRSDIPAAPPWYYPMLVTHIFLGTVALVAACGQVWPWLRRRHPTVHRAVGRIYVLGAVVPAALVVLTITPFNPAGPAVQVAATLLAVLWLATSLAGYRAARRRQFAEHREWMIRSVALTFSIVADRLWLPVCFAMFVPGLFRGEDVERAALDQAIGAALWLSIVGNLLVAEWWLQRSRRPRPRPSSPAPESDPTSSARQQPA